MSNQSLHWKRLLHRKIYCVGMCINPKIKVLFFASCRDAVGHKSCDWEIAEGYRVADLQRELVAAYPQLAAVQQVLSVAVNAEYVGDHTVLKAGDEVALIPPVSGG